MIEIYTDERGVTITKITPSTDPRICDCGCWIGECDCEAFAQQAAAAPVIYAGQPAEPRPVRRSHPDTAHRALPAVLREGGTR